MRRRFLDALRERVVLGDGAMGTELLSRGAAKDRNLALLNLEDPERVLAIHREYVAAGAELIRTNTFTANRLRMPPERVGPAIQEACRLARRAAGPDRWVAGSVGPLADVDAPENVKGIVHREQCDWLASGGCDVLMLETFLKEDDLKRALFAAASSGLPVIALRAEPGFWSEAAEDAGRGADVVGYNCIDADQLAAWSDPLDELPPARYSAFPSAGRPGSYRSAEDFVEKAAPLLRPELRLVGGCCGTTPAHIHALGARLAETRR